MTDCKHCNQPIADDGYGDWFHTEWEPPSIRKYNCDTATPKEAS